MQNEALYLWGFEDGLPAFAGGPLGNGQGAALVLHSGSTLRIPETIDVVVYDGVTDQFVHLNPLLAQAGTNQISFGDGFLQLAKPGDFDFDGDVDGNDFLKWQRTLGTSDSMADGDDSGTVGPEDLAIWKNHYGEVAGSTSSSTTVPEPSALILLLAMASVACRRERIR